MEFIKGFLCPICGWQNYQLVGEGVKAVECCGCNEVFKVK